MPIVPEGSLILVTGATGYVGFNVVRELLDRGFSVRATGRSASKGDALISHPLFKEAGKRLTYAIVPDMSSQTSDGMFDNVLEGVTGILHVASPIPKEVKSSVQEDLIDPAINGTTGILKAALKYPQIKRVVITSSFAAMMGITASTEPGKVLTEEDWNTGAVKLLEESNGQVDPLTGYMASKTLAEKEAWKLMKETKPHFDLITILPTVVFGPPFGLVTSSAQLDFANGAFYKSITGQPLDEWKELIEKPQPYVDIFDVAYAHVESLVRPSAANRRIVLCGEQRTLQGLLNSTRKKYPDLASSVPNAEWGLTPAKSEELQYTVDTSPSRELLGLKYKGLEESTKTVVESLLEAKKKDDWDPTV